MYFLLKMGILQQSLCDRLPGRVTSCSEFTTCLALLAMTFFACSFSLGKHLNTQDRQGPSLLALLNGPVDPRGGSNIFWAGPHGSNYVYKVRGTQKLVPEVHYSELLQ